MTLIHGTGIFYEGKAVLLRGVSGSGKSDLALRMMACGAKLIGDDYLEVTQGEDGRLIMASPSTIRGRIEVRNVGILEVPYQPSAPIDLILLLGDIARLERLPEARTICLEGVVVPCLEFYAFEASAPEKFRAALKILDQLY